MQKEIFKVVFGWVIGAAVMWIKTGRKYNEEIDRKNTRIDKFKNYFDIMNEWVRLKNHGINLEEYFVKNGWSHIAVYGMGELGNRLLEELKGGNVMIDYAIDKNSDEISSEIEVKNLNEELPIVDAIVVTPIFAYDMVEETLVNLVQCPIVSIEDVVYFS